MEAGRHRKVYYLELCHTEYRTPYSIVPCMPIIQCHTFLSFERYDWYAVYYRIRFVHKGRLRTYFNHPIGPIGITPTIGPLIEPWPFLGIFHPGRAEVHTRPWRGVGWPRWLSRQLCCAVRRFSLLLLLLLVDSHLAGHTIIARSANDSKAYELPGDMADRSNPAVNSGPSSI